MRLTIRLLGLDLLDLELTTDSTDEPDPSPHAIGFQVELSPDTMLDNIQSDRSR